MSTFEIAAVEPETVAIAAVTRDAELLCRARGIDSATVAEYAEALQAGTAFPPVVVFRDPNGVHWLADGFHRCAAAELIGLSEVAADVRQGGRREALLHAAGANAAHGLRRTNADKRRAVLLVIAACPKWSNRRVAEACGVHHDMVSAARNGMADSATLEAVGSGETAPLDLDRLVARLTKALTRVFEQWPADRRAELRKLLDAAEPST